MASHPPTSLAGRRNDFATYHPPSGSAASDLASGATRENGSAPYDEGLSNGAEKARDNLEAAYRHIERRQTEAGHAARRYAMIGASMLTGAAFLAATMFVEWATRASGSAAVSWPAWWPVGAGLAAALGVGATTAFVAAIDRRRQSAEYVEELQIVGFERDLMDLAPKERGEECRAARLLARNECQLRHFNTLSRRESSWWLALSALCVIVGCALTLGTLYFVKESKSSTFPPVAWIGAVGTLFANVVAAMVLKLNGDVGHTLRKSYARLVHANQTLLAGVLVARLPEGELHDDTLRTLALSIVGRNSSDLIRTEADGGVAPELRSGAAGGVAPPL